MGYNAAMAKATIEMDEWVAAALRAQAEAQQLSLMAFLERIAWTGLHPLTYLPISEGKWGRMFDEVEVHLPEITINIPARRHIFRPRLMGTF